VVLGLGRLGLWSTPSGARAAAEFVCAATSWIDYRLLRIKNCLSSYSGLLRTATLMISDDDRYLCCYCYRWWHSSLLPIMDYSYPSLSTMLMISGRWSLLDDVVVMSLFRCCWWCCLPSPFSPATLPVVEVMICCVCVPVQLFADEHLLRRSWICLRLKPRRPFEIDRLLERDKWTLDDDVCWWIFFAGLDLVFEYRAYCIIVSEHPVRLSVCHPVHCRTADVCVFTLIFTLVFTQHLFCIYSLISVPLSTYSCYWSS